MTSKGALSLIKEEFISNIENEETNDCWNESDKEADINWWKEKFEIIEKDLKVLNILKNKLFVNHYDGTFTDICLKEHFITEDDEDFNLIKEWLENE